MGQKYAVFNELGLPQAFYDSDIHSNIPENAIQITEEQWIEFIQNQGRRRWNFEKRQVEEFNPEDLLKFDELKQRKLAELIARTRAYIEQYYPEVKQRSDVSDKEYWSSWLMARNQSYTAQQIYFLVFQSVAKILSGQTTLNAELQNYPETERVAWEQLIKVGLRIAFVQAVKQEYHQLAQAIKNARTKEELERLQIQFKTRFPL